MAERIDFLVIGSGIAGLTYALKVASYGTVAVVTKQAPEATNTWYAQGGIAAVIDSADSIAEHIEDTLVAGAGLCKPEVVRMVVEEGPQRVQELIEWGARFTRKKGRLSLAREGGHSRHRIVHAADATGREVMRVLLEHVRAHPNIQILDHHFVLDLITEHHLGHTVTRFTPDIHCYGAYVLDQKTGEIKTFLSRATFLATGGAGQVYLHTTNPLVATGDGVAMAYRAKARVANMEFFQFHPTALYESGVQGQAFLISEAVRGAGGILYNQAGERFMPQYDPRAELAPRDIVARAIDDQLKQRGEDFVYLDISHLPEDEILEHFPNIAAACKARGIDITTDPIPVVPAAHYLCGGVVTDMEARTSIHGLFAAGEVACTGLHGANRLASNSLLEALVFSHRAVRSALAYAQENTWQEGVPDWDDSGTTSPQEWVLISHNREELKRVMANYVGIVRSELRLKRAFRRTQLLYEETEDFYRRATVSAELCELRNLIAVAYLIIRSALMRRESIGLHYTLDAVEPASSAVRDTLL